MEFRHLSSESFLASALRAYVRAPAHPAKYRVERWLGDWLLPHEGGVFEVQSDVRLRLHPRDWIEYTLIRDAQYEPLTLHFLEANLHRVQQAMLAGVNFGLHVVVASRAAGDSGMVVGVDPQQSALDRTRSHLALNCAETNVRLVAAALGAAGQILVMDDPPETNTGAANVRKPGTGPLCAVSMAAGELWRALRTGQPSPDLCLLDVEGYEGEVLAGFDPSFRPGVMIVELWDPFLREVEWSNERVCALLTSMGYELFTLDGQPTTGATALPEHNVVAVHTARTGAPVVFGGACTPS